MPTRSLLTVQHRHPFSSTTTESELLRKQFLIEPDLAEFIDDHYRFHQFWRAQRGVDERGLAAAEKTGDQRHRNPALGIGRRPFACHANLRSEHFAAGKSARNQPVGRKVGDDLAAVLSDDDLFLDAGSAEPSSEPFQVSSANTMPSASGLF